MSQSSFFASVAKVIDPYRIVINKGKGSGINTGERILVYDLSDEEIKDPESGESLGRLEIVKGTGVVVHVQDKMSIIESDRKSNTGIKTIRKKTVGGTLAMLGNLGHEIIEEQGEPESLPFEDPEVGDKVKRV